MNRTDIINNIRVACRCGKRRAGEYLDAELRSLGELRDAGELHYGNYRLYEYIPSKDEVRGRFIARKPFSLAAFRHLTRTIPNDATLFLRIVSTDLYTLYLEGYVYSHGEWHALRL